MFLDKGSLLALGTHDELLASCPPYREIAELQMGSAAEIA
jgi:ABC-type multidrug transport system fused ATPase/permease subunit